MLLLFFSFRSFSFFFICSTHNFFTVNIFFRFRNLSHEFAEYREHIYNEKVFPLDAYYAHTAHGQRSHSLSHFMHEILVYSAGEYFDWIAEIYSSLAQSESLHSAFYSVLLPKPSFIHIWERKCDGKYRPLQFIWTPKKQSKNVLKSGIQSNWHQYVMEPNFPAYFAIFCSEQFFSRIFNRLKANQIEAIKVCIKIIILIEQTITCVIFLYIWSFKCDIAACEMYEHGEIERMWNTKSRTEKRKSNEAYYSYSLLNSINWNLTHTHTHVHGRKSSD